MLKTLGKSKLPSFTLTWMLYVPAARAASSVSRYPVMVKDPLLVEPAPPTSE